MIVTPVGATARVVAVVGADRVAARHDEPAGAELHVPVRHGEFHNRLVAAVVAALAVAIDDGLVVQAVDVGAGNDGHGGVFVGVEVPCRAGRSIRVPRGYAVHLEHTAIRYGDVVGIGQPRLAVEDAAGHGAVVIRQAHRKGSARNRSAGGVCHTAREGATADGAAV